MLNNVSVRLPLSVHSDLMDFSRESKESFETFLTNAVRDYIQKHRQKPAPQPAKVIPIYEASRPKKDKLKVASLDDCNEGQH